MIFSRVSARDMQGSTILRLAHTQTEGLKPIPTICVMVVTSSSERVRAVCSMSERRLGNMKWKLQRQLGERVILILERTVRRKTNRHCPREQLHHQ